jgi:hypothetical protein
MLLVSSVPEQFELLLQRAALILGLPDVPSRSRSLDERSASTFRGSGGRKMLVVLAN